MSSGSKSVGHPVDVATGTMYSTHRDYVIPGRVELVWERRYSTALLESPAGPFGPGWTTRYFSTLTRVAGEYRFIGPEGELQVFSDAAGEVERGGVVRNLGTFQELMKSEGRYLVVRWDVDSGNVERYVFREKTPGEVWLLECIEDVTGQGLDMLRDRNGRLIGVRQRFEHRTLTIDYDSGGRIGAITFRNPNGQTLQLARYAYDTAGRLVTAFDALGAADRYEYDSAGRIVREIVKDGGVFSFRYDAQGRCQFTTGLDRYDEKTLRYFDNVRQTQVTDSLGNVSRYECLPSGQVVSEFAPDGGVRQTEYDEHGRIVCKVDPLGKRTEYGYDEQGNRAQIVDALGGAYVLTFNDAHLPIACADPDGNVWTREYDHRNLLIGKSDPLGRRWKFTYDARGALVGQTAPDGATRSQRISAAGGLEEVTDYEGNRTRFRTDELGRIVERIDSLGNSTRATFDLLHRLLELRMPDDSRVLYRYNEAGNLIRFTNALGQSLQFRFGSCGRIVERRDSLDRVVKFRWGTEPDHLEEVVNEVGQSHRFLRDAMGRVVREIFFDGSDYRVTYDVAGNPVEAINGAGEPVRFEVNGAGQITKLTLPDGAESGFEFDAAGRMVAAANADCALSYERNVLGQVIRESQGGVTLEKEFDARGRMTELKTSLGYRASYGYDGNGLVRQVTPHGFAPIEITRNAARKETVRLLSGGVRLSQSYDSLGQLVEQLLHAGSQASGRGADAALAHTTAIVHRTYQYDARGAIREQNDARWGREEYTYDAAERLLSVQRSGAASERFSYDLTDNLTSMMRPDGHTEELAYGQGNRLQRRGDCTYTYDGAGRLTSKSEAPSATGARQWRYTWDALNRLRAVTTPDGEVWKYKYDPMGRRISKESSRGSVRFVWNADTCLQEQDESGGITSWVYDVHSWQALCQLQNGALYSVINDALGTPRELVDEWGRVTWAASYRAWGEVREEQFTEVRCPLRFQGQRFDPETGLHHSFFRYYDPSAGRFISPDPLGITPGLNIYAYAPNPINWVDPLGLSGGFLFRGDDGYTGGPIGTPIGSPRAEAADVKTPAEHVRKESNQTSVFTSFAETKAATEKFADKSVKVSRADLNALAATNPPTIKIHTPDDVHAQMLADGFSKKEANAVRDIMEKNKEVLIEGEIPEEMVKKCK